MIPQRLNPVMTSTKKPASTKPAAETASDDAAPETTKQGAFKQKLRKPEPWSFGGRGGRGNAGGGGKVQPDAERRAGKSRKVH
jgi:hypothetical protein